MKTTRYFEEQILRKRPYIKREWCEQALREPVRSEVAIRWTCPSLGSDSRLERYWRVVTLEDRMTVHNAFLDRNFKKTAS